jgi:hypothetical protein
VVVLNGDEYLPSSGEMTGPLTWPSGASIDGDEDIVVAASDFAGSVYLKTGDTIRMVVEGSRILAYLPLELDASINLNMSSTSGIQWTGANKIYFIMDNATYGDVMMLSAEGAFQFTTLSGWTIFSTFAQTRIRGECEAPYFVSTNAAPTAANQLTRKDYVDNRTAWGVVAMGAFKTGMTNPISVTTTQVITDALLVHFNAGRRYRIVLQLRAVVGVTAAVSLAVTVLDFGATKANEWGDLYCNAQTTGAAFDSLQTGFIVEGDNADHSITMTAAANAGGTIQVHFNQNCRFYVEDIGPV